MFYSAKEYSDVVVFLNSIVFFSLWEQSVHCIPVYSSWTGSDYCFLGLLTGAVVSQFSVEDHISEPEPKIYIYEKGRQKHIINTQGSRERGRKA